ncbi:3-ketoacyl-CoA synthase [Quillaja saponaria]|uniref:3-ketoacyl-CoA synthase n=1 Tax=Quillaja saponaria TaxID=32244 RepID=A0AAD7QBM1_QUISA|nr:3-ketoacyl-CoA synthase [Quillaja saponaria]
MDIFMLEQPYMAKILIFLTHHKLLVATAIFAALLYLHRISKRVYLIDFMCYRAPHSLRVPTSSFIEHVARLEKFDGEAAKFLTKVIERSGLGSETCLPNGSHLFPEGQTLNYTMEEVKMVLFSIVQNLLSKQKINPKSIDILITNCSLICPSPSLSSMIINKFGFRSNIKSYSLSGMGCSAGILSISLARDLLKVHKNSLVLILSTESVCSNIYKGKNKSMLLANCLFRMGGAAVLLSNRRKDRDKAKYELKHLVRTHHGFKDSSYNCVMQEPDDEDITGVTLSRSIIQVAGEALKTNEKQ